jgi:hypothetical protein
LVQIGDFGALFWPFFPHKMVKKRKNKNSSYKYLANNICQVFVRGILNFSLFEDFIGEKRPKKCPKITYLHQNQSF